MNRIFKIIGAALLTAVMCASFAGCAKEEKKSELNESNIESHIESIFGGGSADSDPSAKPEESEPEEVKLAMTDEIKNAALGSGLVQLNNDIFQRGGYMTAADLVEKYKESYDITYNCPIGYVMSEAGTYDECKDYLLEYHDEFFESRTYIGRHWAERENSMGGVYGGGCYYLKLTPKTGNSASVIAYVVNAVSPDEKITLDRAIVAMPDFAMRCQISPQILGNFAAVFLLRSPLHSHCEVVCVQLSKNSSLHNLRRLLLVIP